MLFVIISSSAAVIITTASEGCCLKINVDMGCNKLLLFSTYMVIFLMRTGLAEPSFLPNLGAYINHNATQPVTAQLEVLLLNFYW